MEILNFLSKGCGYKLIDDSKNIKIWNEIFLELLSFSFFRNRKSRLQNSSEKQTDCDLRLKQVKILFSVIQQVTYRKYHSS